MRLRRAPLVLLGLLAIPAWATEDGPADMLALFDQFVSAGAAASRCSAPTDYIAVRFLANFQWVTRHASQELQLQSPNATAEQVAQALALRSLAIKTQTHAMVREQGCDSDPVRELVRRFTAQTEWTPSGT